jgi:hypothetical protein
MAGIGVAAVDALFAETGALPNEVVDGALQLGDPFFEIVDGGVSRHRALLVVGTDDRAMRGEPNL